MSVVVSRLTKLYRTDPPLGLRDCTLELPDDHLTVVVGPSGAGKTTLLRLIAGLERPDSGRIVIDGRDVTDRPPHERGVALVAQTPAIYPHLTVGRNLTIGLEMSQQRQPRRQRLPAAEIVSRAAEAAEMLGLGGLLERRADRLSGGEAQRVALGRVLVRRPAVTLLDEPLSHLDVPLREEIRARLLLLRRQWVPTMVYVTHDPVEALSLGSRLAVLFDGAVRQVDDPRTVYARPNHRFTASFLGQPAMNLVEGTAAIGDDGAVRFATADGSLVLPLPTELAAPGLVGRVLVAGLRAEDLSPTPPAIPDGSRIALPGWEVEATRFQPPNWRLTVRRGPTRWNVWTSAPVAGPTVDLTCDPTRVHWFDAATGDRLTFPG